MLFDRHWQFLSSLELLSASPFPPMKPNSRDTWLGESPLRASFPPTESWRSKSYASLPLKFARLLRGGIGAYRDPRGDRSHLPRIFENDQAICILLGDYLMHWCRAAAHTLSASTRLIETQLLENADGLVMILAAFPPRSR